MSSEAGSKAVMQQSTYNTDTRNCTPGFASEDLCRNRCASPRSAAVPLPLESARGSGGATAPLEAPSASCLSLVPGRRAWQGRWVQPPPQPASGDMGAEHDSPRWEFSNGCPVERLPPETLRSVLRGQRIVFVGDCIMRYQYLLLVHYIEHGAWGPMIVDQEDIMRAGSGGRLPRSIAVGYSLARHPTLGKTVYSRFFLQSNRMLRGNERCDCGEHDTENTPYRKHLLEDKFENRYYRNTQLNLSISFFFIKGVQAVHGHGGAHADPPLRNASTASWRYATLPALFAEQVASLRPSVLLMNIGLWWFKADFERHAYNASWWDGVLDAAAATVGPNRGPRGERGLVVLRTTTATAPWRGHAFNNNDGVDGQLLQTNEVDHVVRRAVDQRARLADERPSDDVAWGILDTYALTANLPEAHCHTAMGDASRPPLKFFTDDMHLQPFVYREINYILVGLLARYTRSETRTARQRGVQRG